MLVRTRHLSGKEAINPWCGRNLSFYTDALARRSIGGSLIAEREHTIWLARAVPEHAIFRSVDRPASQVHRIDHR